ncbi:MAG TPA: hypothetical protein PLW09_09085 [Candidatus Kapabacteria bacterium]|nr:hypothetical protein [Candidatus Kapabacteria bacterium]
MNTIKKILFFVCFLVAYSALAQDPTPKYNPTTVSIARSLSKDLLGNNSTGFLTPLVTTSNATSNSRFFRSAHVPKKVDKPYFRFGIHGMTGAVRDDQKSFTPTSPVGSSSDELNKTFSSFIELPVTRDTSKLIYGIIRYIFAKGLEDPNSGITFPTSSPTIFGKGEGYLTLDKDYFAKEVDGLLDALRIINPNAQLSEEQRISLNNAINGLPSAFPLPTGGDISQVYAGVPQLEIGSFYGTELLLRFIPPVQFDKNIGDFSFYGIGLKHSLSQYFDETPLDVAVQVVYQKTNLTQIVGVTEAELSADANIYNANLQFSKKFKDITPWFGDLEFFGGYSFEQFNIVSTYTYTLPVTLQKDLGLRREINGKIVPDPENGYPGDTEPQVAKGTIEDTNHKLILGVAKPIGPLTIALDYSISRFNLFSLGLDFTF